MLLSMVTISHADEAIEVTYLNADSTKIMVDLSADVAVADLTAAVSLKKDGVAVNFTVVKKPASVASTGAMTASDDTSYVIKPEGGVEFDAIYNLNIAGTDCNKLFTVEELWRDDFQAYTGATGATTSWRNGTLYVDGSEQYLQVTGMAGKGVYPYYAAYMFSTYGKKASEFFDAARLATTDYNVEAKVKFNESSDGSAYKSIQISMQSSGSESVGRWGSSPCIAGGALYNIKADGTNEYNKMLLHAYQKGNATDRQGIGTTNDNFHQCDGPRIEEQTFNDAWNTISMSVKGNNAKVFAGEDAFANYNHTLDLSAGYGAVVFVSRISGTYYIDDVIATKMRELELDDLEVTYWNADSTKIMIDLSAEVDATALANAVTLKEDGTPVSFTVAAKPATPTATGGMTASADYSYVIIPQDGITFDAVYELNIAAGLLSKNKLSILPEAYSKKIVVEKLWKETFENYTDSLPWKCTESSDRNPVLDTKNGNKVMKVTPTSRVTIVPDNNSSVNFADTGVATKTYWASGSEAIGVEDYNVEVNFTSDLTSTGNTQKSLRISMQKSINNADQSYVYGIAGGAYYYIKPDNSGEKKQMYAQIGNGTKGDDGTTNVYQGAATTSNLVNALGPVTVSEKPFDSDVSNLAMSVKEQNVKIFAGDAFVNYDFTYTIDNNGVVGLVNYGSNTFYVDDIVVTKAKEAPASLTFGELSVANGAGEAIESLAGVDAVDVSVAFNRIGASLPCKVVLAVYGANNTLKNYAFSTVTSFDGADTIEFNDVATNGGTSIKVFFWDSLATLMPYRATAQWPSAN